LARVHDIFYFIDAMIRLTTAVDLTPVSTLL